VLECTCEASGHGDRAPFVGRKEKVLSAHILLVGVNHTTAPVALRERLSIAGTALTDALTRFSGSNGHGSSLFPEGVILSTCNRLEIYAVAGDVDRGHEALTQFLSQDRNVPIDEFADSLYIRPDAEAVVHLNRVACGLDSMVVGEPQILGQVTDAYRAALSRQATGPVLNRLFRHAIQAGKRARSETAISQCATSVPSAAAALVEEVMGCLDGRVVLVMGAGEMGQIAARTLVARGARGIIVANRTYDRGLALARELNGEAMTFDRQAEALARADIVVTATDAPHVIVTPEKVTAAMAQRPERPMLIIDIAVPRDTAPAVADIPGVRLFDIDDLHDVVNGNLAAREREIPHVEAIAAEETAEFLTWFRALDVVPTITDLRRRAEALKAQELDKALRRLGDLGDREQEVVRALAHGLVNKLLHEPTVRLKKYAVQGNGYLYTDVVRELFGLEIET
jgi:glutamyl-tRNA reductase